tara:strand:+ start:279 stop:1334 length:1056 start_codon:yes stop_codon:yes gene_type:complete
MSARIPVIIISGFLGSGKTTFLKYLLKKTDKQFGLIINEFGDIGIDGDLLKNCSKCNEDSSGSIIELNNGCLCCTVQDDFIPSIQTLLKTNTDLDAIIIETSGLALPKPLLKALNWPEIRTSIYLDFVIATVNGESMINGSPINDLYSIQTQYKNTQKIDHSSSIEELFCEQLEVSDIVLVSRSDVISEKQFNHIKRDLQRKIKPNVPIIKSFNGKTNLGFILDSSIKKNDYQEILTDEHNHSHAKIFSDFIKNDYFLEKKQFEFEMSLILRDINILRIKGRVWIPKKSLPLQVQIVGRKINTWYEKVDLNSVCPPEQGGMELIIISFEKNDFIFIKDKIKEKFKILSDSK